MAQFMLLTGRGQSEYLRLTLLERTEFTRLANQR